VRDLTRAFKALSETPRLQILALVLRHGELCGCEVERFLDLSQSASSRHLRVLRDAGLLADRRHGSWVYYGVPAWPDPMAAGLLTLLRARIEEVDLPDVEEELVAMRAVRCGLGTGPGVSAGRAATPAEMEP
jgi:ArsR family transcriptional regulator